MGPVESTLLRAIQEKSCIHLALIDPEKSARNLPKTLRELEDFGTPAIMVGGSTVASSKELDATVKAIKNSCSLPVILFPNGPSGISPHADAIFFMSLLNSSKTQFIIGAQVQGASMVKRFRLEPIPLGYILVGQSNSAVSLVSQADLVPYSKPELAVSYALAAQYFGMRFVYLEAGSGAAVPVDANMIRQVSKEVDIPVIVGGGIRTPEQALQIARAGAAAVVTGTIIEREGAKDVGKIVQALRRP